MAAKVGESRDMKAEVVRHVASRVSRLQGGIVGERKDPGALRKLAVLRRAAGEAPGATPEAYAIEVEDMPETLFGAGDGPSWAEWAVHVALTLYAVHQQSQQAGMHLAPGDGDDGVGRKRGIGYAVKKLRAAQVRDKPAGDGKDDLGEMPQRFAAMVTAESMEEVAHYARQTVQQLRAESIPLDYARFAGQLYLLQVPGRADEVRLEWSREYALRLPSKDGGNDAGQSRDGEKNES